MQGFALALLNAWNTSLPNLCTASYSWKCIQWRCPVIVSHSFLLQLSTWYLPWPSFHLFICLYHVFLHENVYSVWIGTSLFSTGLPTVSWTVAGMVDSDWSKEGIMTVALSSTFAHLSLPAFIFLPLNSFKLSEGFDEWHLFQIPSCSQKETY